MVVVDVTIGLIICARLMFTFSGKFYFELKEIVACSMTAMTSLTVRETSNKTTHAPCNQLLLGFAMFCHYSFDAAWVTSLHVCFLYLTSRP